jgi:hypothetical protein
VASSFIGCPFFCVRARPDSTKISWPLSCVCHADRAPGSKLRRPMPRSAASIVSDRPVNRGSSCCADPVKRAAAISTTTNAINNAMRFMNGSRRILRRLGD